MNEEILQLIQQYDAASTEADRKSLMTQIKALDKQVKAKKTLENQVNKFQKLRDKINRR